MATNNSTSRYYREHTRQQDGWTVLAAPPPADLPPPYTAEDNAAPAVAPGDAATPSLPFEIPTNSNIIGAAPVTRNKNFAKGTPFAVALPEISTIMGLNPLRASIGYKWDNERASAAVHGLSTAGEWDTCLENGINMQKRARTRTVVCSIKNLNLPEIAPATSSTLSGSTTSKKRKANSTDTASDRKTYDFTDEYRQLKKHLECAQHRRPCYVLVDGNHKEVPSNELTLWAKEITHGRASFSRPPENIVFQEYFLPAPKRRVARHESSNQFAAPTINVTVNTGSGGTSTNSHNSPQPSGSSRRSPLSNITAATASDNNIDMPSSLFRTQPDPDMNTGPQDVCYPAVIDILQGIDDSGALVDTGALDFPAVIFADELANYEITRVDHVPYMDASFYVHLFHMPQVLAELLVDESIAAMGRAQKGKGRM